MADYLASYTHRYKVTYVTCGKKHTSTWRFAGSATPDATFVNNIAAFFTALSPYLYTDWTVVATEAAAANSEVFLPALGFVVTGTGGTAEAGSAPKFIGFTGRNAVGKKTRLQIFGYSSPPGIGILGDYRLTPVEQTALGGILTALTEIDTVGADGVGPVHWHPYANVGYSSYWQRKLRS